MIISGVLTAAMVTACISLSIRGNKTIKLGVIVPLTGEEALYGQSVKNGIELAVEDYNAKGGILGAKIETVVYDDKADPVKAVNAFEKLANKDEVDAVIGGILTSTAMAVAPLSQKYNLPTITPTATNKDITKGYKTLFRAGYTNDFQGRGLAQFAYDQLNARRAAVIYNIEKDYSIELANTFKAAFEKKGASVVNYEGYTADTKDFSSIITNIKDADADVLFIPEYYSTAAQIIKQVKQAGLHIELLGTNGWEGWERVENGEEIFEGGYFSNQYAVDEPRPQNRYFLQRYRKKYKETPNASAALGSDAAVILLEAMKKAGTTESNKIIEWLESIRLQGVTGSITFYKEHDPIKTLYMFKIHNGKNILIQKQRMDVKIGSVNWTSRLKYGIF